MVVDTSSIIAIFKKEEDWERHLKAIEKAASVNMSAAALYETAVVLYGTFRRREVIEELLEFLKSYDIQIIPFGTAEAIAATNAYITYGKGIHPAGLNLLDCVSYSLASKAGRPLLYKGNEFPKTDVGSIL